MEENLQKILKEKDENVVQFNLINTTNQPQYVDFFNSASLTPVATSLVYSNPPNSVYNSFSTGGLFPNYSAYCPNNGFIYVSDGGSNIIRVYDTNNNNAFVTTIVFGGFSSIAFMLYNPINNVLYACDTSFAVIQQVDCNTNTTLGFIGLVGSCSFLALNTLNNTIYSVSPIGGYISVIDCATSLILTTIPLLVLNYIEYNSVNNLIYVTDGGISNDITIIDCVTNSVIGTITLTNPNWMQYNASNNTLYVQNNSNTEIAVVDCNTNTLLSSTPIPLGLGTLQFSTLNFYQNTIYFGTSLGYTILFDCNTNLILNYYFVFASSIGMIQYINNLASVYFGMSFTPNFYILTTTGITATPFYVTGSTNYNAFVNNLNNEPIAIQMIRLVTQNQNQLTNQLQLTTIDSNGNQTFTPNFPINQVSSYQQQGNIGELAFKDIIFDGRTYINQYQLNPNESLSFEIYYKQLDLTSANAGFPIFFKEKVQLKKYIKEDYSDYEIEL